MVVIRKKDALGELLVHAVLSGDEDLTELCLSGGADVDFQLPREDYFRGLPPLLVAIVREDVDLARFLIVEQGADPTKYSANESLFMLAAYTKNKDLISLFIQHGALAKIDNFECNPLNLCLSTDRSLFDFVIAKAEQYLSKGQFAHLMSELLYVAISVNKEDVFDLCLEKGADLQHKAQLRTYKTMGYKSVLHAAIKNNNSFFLEKICTQSFDFSNIAFKDLIDDAVWDKDLECAKLLFQHFPADLVIFPDWLVGVAIENSDLEMCDLLLEHGGKVSEKNQQAYQALQASPPTVQRPVFRCTKDTYTERFAKLFQEIDDLPPISHERQLDLARATEAPSILAHVSSSGSQQAFDHFEP